MFGNVDSHSDSFTWDGAVFNASTDTTLWTPGSYCFIFNPTESAGDSAIRLTREFEIGEEDDDEGNGKKEREGDGTYKNHGQYVRSQKNKREAAQSRIGMPAKSKGHNK